MSTVPSAPLQPVNDDAQLIRLWLLGRGPNVAAAARKDANRLLVFTGKPLPQMMSADVQAFCDALALLVPATCAQTVIAVKSLFAFGHRHGLLPHDVARAVSLPLACRPFERDLPETIFQRVLAREPDARNRVLLGLLYTTGASMEEIRELSWQDLQEQDGCGAIVTRSKGSEARTMLVPAPLWQELIALRRGTAPTALVFTANAAGGQLVRIQIEQIIATAARRAGLPACGAAGFRLLSRSGSKRVGMPTNDWLPLRSSRPPATGALIV